MNSIKLWLLMLTLSLSLGARANEGMWLPMLLKGYNEAEMKKLGMKITAEDIYSVSKGSLKDAVGQFGGGCTSELVSAQGLLLTNHHCGYSTIQSHSTLDHNYLKDGFWAKTLKDEIPSPGLTVMFISRIDDVTKQVLDSVRSDMTDKERQSQIDRNLSKVRASIKKESYEDVAVRSFFEGNQYFAFITVTYKDVRFVGAPPSSIGNFGVDTDNWMWPRHTCDFSVFRVYTDKNGKPAEYSEDNIPMKPKYHLNISMDGVKEGDFNLVMGFPGRTDSYLPAVAVEQIQNVTNPTRVEVRDAALKIVGAAMREDPKTKIMYASKFASISNYWKKWIGETQGLKTFKAVEKKRAYEKEFTRRLDNNPTLLAKYGNILPEFEKNYKAIEKYSMTRDYFTEIFIRNSELPGLALQLDRLNKLYEASGEKAFLERRDKIIGDIDRFYKDYNPNLDKKVLTTLVELYNNKVDPSFVPDYAKNALKDNNNSYEKWISGIYAGTKLTNIDQFKSLLAGDQAESIVNRIKEDPAYLFAKSYVANYERDVQPNYNDLIAKINSQKRGYMAAQMEVFPEKKYFPDANSTLRVAYGKVAGYNPRDGVKYHYMTYLDGVMEKYKPGDYEFDVPEKLMDLYNKKDYGQYGEHGKLPVNFIGTAQTTGGNSGSPVLDAKGRLLGLLFDGSWEGVMSDIYFDEDIVRSIMVDIRYVLFVIDKYADAGHLVKEMTLSKTPAAKVVPIKGKKRA